MGRTTHPKDFIKANFPNLGALFADVNELAGAPVDLLTNKAMEAPSVDLFLAGFVCKSISTENVERTRYATCILDGSGSTGSTFEGVRNFVASKRPPLVIFENVEGLLKKIAKADPQIWDVQRTLHKIGYLFGWHLLDSRWYHLPHRRRRVWMWAVDSRELSMQMEEQMIETMGRLLLHLGRCKPPSLDTVLMGEEELAAATRSSRALSQRQQVNNVSLFIKMGTGSLAPLILFTTILTAN